MVNSLAQKPPIGSQPQYSSSMVDLIPPVEQIYATNDGNGKSASRFNENLLPIERVPSSQTRLREELKPIISNHSVAQPTPPAQANDLKKNLRLIHKQGL